MTRAPAPKNGRRRRQLATRAAILTATQRIMAGGNFRPTAREVGRADGFSARSLHEHFPTLEALYIAAVNQETAEAIVNQLPAHDHRLLALTVVLGKVPS